MNSKEYAPLLIPNYGEFRKIVNTEFHFFMDKFDEYMKHHLNNEQDLTDLMYKIYLKTMKEETKRTEMTNTLKSMLSIESTERSSGVVYIRKKSVVIF